MSSVARGYANDESLMEIDNEVFRARQKFPGNRFLLTALMEEVGELAQAILQRDEVAITKEAIQVACVAVRIMEEGDPVYDTLTDAESKS